MRRILMMGAAASVLLGACATMPGGHVDASPELGAWGIDLAQVDATVDPGDDFFRYVNGVWLDTFEIPADRTNYGSFTVLAERAEVQVRAIIEDAAAADAPSGSSEQKIGDLFNSFMDVDAIEAAGLAPIQDGLDDIAAASTHDDVVRLFARSDFASGGFINAFVGVDSKNTGFNITYMGQGGLGLPDRDYYLEDNERYTTIRAAYVEHMAAMFTLAGIEGGADKAQAILALETRMAGAHWERARRRDRDQTYNLMSVDELMAYAPGVDWRMALDATGLSGAESVVLREKDAIPQLAEIFTDTPVSTWRDYMTFNALSNYASYLPAAFDEEDFAFYGATLRGQPEQRERWKRGVSVVNGNIGFEVGQVYVARHFPPEAKAEMELLVANLRTALSARIDTLDWMTDETKVEAHAKLEAFTPKIGYPDVWEDYSALDIVPGDLIGNIRRSQVWQWADNIAKLDQPVDDTEWGMTPQTVNAYYSPPRNEIVFPAAILQAPFFDLNADDAVNYGGIGAVIGHEIGHGFDDQGRKSDGDGTLRDWWTDADAAAFELKTDALGAQYGAYEPVEGYTLNPELTMGENLGDLGGMNMALEAYSLSLDGEDADVLDGYSGEQRFFMAWAQVWRRKYREEELINRIATDPHSPSEYRTNGVVRNMAEWYEAFGVETDDELYLPEDERVSVW